MDQSDPKRAFGDTLARYYHQSESKTAGKGVAMAPCQGVNLIGGA
jgi:hypothetical protein